MKFVKISGYIISVVTFVSCIFSVLRNDLYQDSQWASVQWLGQDLVTLLVVVPLLLFVLRKGTETKWKIILTGILFYFFYTYAFFMFAAELSVFYPLHLPIFGFSTLALVAMFIELFNGKSELKSGTKALNITVSVYFIVISAMLTLLWSFDIISHLIDPVYQSQTPDGKAPLIIYSLDLGIVIPLMVSSAILLLRKSAKGAVLSGIMLVKTSLLGFALMAMSISMYINGLSPDIFLVVLWFVIGVVGTGLTVMFLRGK